MPAAVGSLVRNPVLGQSLANEPGQDSRAAVDCSFEDLRQAYPPACSQSYHPGAHQGLVVPEGYRYVHSSCHKNEQISLSNTPSSYIKYSGMRLLQSTDHLRVSPSPAWQLHPASQDTYYFQEILQTSCWSGYNFSSVSSFCTRAASGSNCVNRMQTCQSVCRMFRCGMTI